MRVLFYLSSPHWTGSARAFDVAGHGLATAGYQVTFACPPSASAEQRLVVSGHEVVPVPDEGTVLTRSWRLRRALIDHFVEVVFVHGEQEQIVGSVAARLAERAAVVRRTPAGGYLTCGTPARIAMRLAATGYLFTNKGELASTPPPPGPLEPVVSDIGVDVGRYEDQRSAVRASLGERIDADTRLIVCVYDPTARIRAATVLRTLALLRPRHPELRLVLVGVGSTDEDLQMHVAALGLTGMVSLLGSRVDELDVLGAADLGWVIADHDTGAFAALDFMALRVPVLVTRGIIAQRYMVDGITGVMLPPGDAPSIAATIASLLAHEEKRTTMGVAGRARVAREYPEEVMVSGFVRAADAARDRSRWIR